MTEAERFLFEKLNPPKPAEDHEEVITQVVSRSVAIDGIGFLKNTIFSTHRLFWCFAFSLIVLLVDAIIMASTNYFGLLEHVFAGWRYDDDYLVGLCCAMITPITFWMPITYLAFWMSLKKYVKVGCWAAFVWMVVWQIFKLIVLFNMRSTDFGQVLVAFIMFLLGSAGIAAVGRMTYVFSRRMLRQDSVGSSAKAPSQPADPIYTVVKLHCPECRKITKAKVFREIRIVRCLDCGTEQERGHALLSMKEPVVAQIVRALFYILGVIASIGIVLSFFSPYGGNSLSISNIIALVLLFAIPHSIKHGYNWGRILLVVFAVLFLIVAIGDKFRNEGLVWMSLVYLIPAVLLFLPPSNAWYTAKKWGRK